MLTYVESFQNFRFGLSAAMAVLSLVLVAIPLSVYLRAVRLDTGRRVRNPEQLRRHGGGVAGRP